MAKRAYSDKEIIKALVEAAEATLYHCNRSNAHAGGFIISADNARQLRSAVGKANKANKER